MIEPSPYYYQVLDYWRTQDAAVIAVIRVVLLVALGYVGLVAGQRKLPSRALALAARIYPYASMVCYLGLAVYLWSTL